MANLFDPITIRSVTIPNRVWMSPMCMYSADPQPQHAGHTTDFHLAHYGARATGGAGLVMLEATAVVPEGRISPWDLGIWDDAHIAGLNRIVDQIHAGGASAAIQLAHAGRKASSARPPVGDTQADTELLKRYGWQPVGPSPAAFPGFPEPHALSLDEIKAVVDAFAQAAKRADQAGFDVVEIHAAHGYLLHQFLSPIANQRTDEYGGSFENRTRIVLEVIDAIRAVWPESKPLFMRISMTDWVEENTEDSRESWTLSQSIQLADLAKAHGVDLIDASSGAIDLTAIPFSDQNYQIDKARELNAQAEVLVGAVGRIETPERASTIVSSGGADAVFLGRPFLGDPSWANHAAQSLEAAPRYIPQYRYAIPNNR